MKNIFSLEEKSIIFRKFKKLKDKNALFLFFVLKKFISCLQ